MKNIDVIKEEIIRQHMSKLGKKSAEKRRKKQQTNIEILELLTLALWALKKSNPKRGYKLEYLLAKDRLKNCIEGRS